MSEATPYLSMLKSLLPRGQAWNRESPSILSATLTVMALAFQRVADRAHDLVEESDPRTTREMLEDWERNYGLPDACTGVATTLQERRQAVLQKKTSIGGQSKAYFIARAAALGYADVTIREYRPFTCGRSRCGETLGGPPTNRFIWTVHVPGPRVTRFKTGGSRCGESLGKVARAVDLECVLQKLSPAHTRLIFFYDGV